MYIYLKFLKNEEVWLAKNSESIDTIRNLLKLNLLDTLCLWTFCTGKQNPFTNENEEETSITFVTWIISNPK